MSSLTTFEDPLFLQSLSQFLTVPNLSYTFRSLCKLKGRCSSHPLSRLGSPSIIWNYASSHHYFLSLFQVLIKINFVWSILLWSLKCQNCFPSNSSNNNSYNPKRFWNPILSDHTFPDDSEKNKVFFSLSIHFYLLSPPPSQPRQPTSATTSSSDHFCQALTFGECLMYISLHCYFGLNFFSIWCV